MRTERNGTTGSGWDGFFKGLLGVTNLLASELNKQDNLTNH